MRKVHVNQFSGGSVAGTKSAEIEAVTMKLYALKQDFQRIQGLVLFSELLRSDSERTAL